jgi:hypothetical protein
MAVLNVWTRVSTSDLEGTATNIPYVESYMYYQTHFASGSGSLQFPGCVHGRYAASALVAAIGLA